MHGSHGIFFYFHHENWGRWTHFDQIILQMSWFNHQVEDICVSSWNIVSPKAQRKKKSGMSLESRKSWLVENGGRHKEETINPPDFYGETFWECLFSLPKRIIWEYDRLDS